MTRRAIVTGASGFVGSALCTLLLDKGHHVLALSRDANHHATNHPHLRKISLPLENYDKLAKVARESYDILFHLAWSFPWGDMFNDVETQFENVLASARLMHEAKEMGVRRFVFLGTCNQYEAMQLEIEHSAKPRMTTVYSSAKLACDLILKTLANSYDIEYCSGLAAMVYGPGDRSSKLPNIVASQLLSGKEPQLVTGNSLYDCIYIDDLVQGLFCIAEKGTPGTSYYLGHQNPRTFREWMIDFKNAIAPEAKLAFGAYPDSGGVDFSKVDTKALYRDTGFRCKATSLESIKATAEWIKENDPLGML